MTTKQIQQAAADAISNPDIAAEIERRAQARYADDHFEHPLFSHPVMATTREPIAVWEATREAFREAVEERCAEFEDEHDTDEFADVLRQEGVCAGV